MSNPNAKEVNILFLHHSVGNGIIEQGEVRRLLAEYNQSNKTAYRLWDHGYNAEGLRDPKGQAQKRNFNIPDDNTNPDGYNTIFLQQPHTPPDNTLSHLLQYDVIIFKSCYPTCNIETTEKLTKFKNYYRTIMGVMRCHPEKLFIPCTPPPLIPSWTNPTESTNARAFAEWLLSPAFLTGTPNVVVFDLFSTLADNNRATSDYNTLHKDYRITGGGFFGQKSEKKDAHPNKKANQTVAPKLVEFFTKAIAQYWGVAV
ncbi:MAG: hypothetical protein HXX20_09680 [Chloroflexi bacterium]|nr:hypothetical protein [Chloroflexota bacterium]